MRSASFPLRWPLAARVRVGFVGAALLAVVLLTPRAPLPGGVLAPLDLVTAETTSALLRVLGVEVARHGAVLAHPTGFAYEIYWRCTGLLPAAFVSGLILASPGRLRARTLGAAAAVLAVAILNLVRLASLFWIGVRFEAAFDFAHAVAWEAVTVALVPGLWLIWVQLASDRKELDS